MASSSPTKNICKFRLENNVFISATEEINASELEEYIVELVQSGILPHGTIFYLMGGIHHGLNSEEEVIPGMTDFKLLQGFYHKIYSCLIELDIWDQKKHDYILIPITCSSQFNHQTLEETYELSKISQRELSKLARKLRKGKKPSLIVFASCFSFNSTIKDFLYSKGVMASLSISHDKGQVTGGKMFSLDQDQQDVIKRYEEVCLFAH